MVDYNTDIPDVEKPKPELSEEQKKQQVEKKLAEPAVFEFAKAKADKEGKQVNEFLTDSSDEEIAEMVAEYEENVEPTIKDYSGFLKNEFFNNFAIVSNDKRTEAAQKAEVYLAKLYIEDPDKFSNYQTLLERHREIQTQLKDMDTDLKRNFRKSEIPQLEAERQYAEDQAAAGEAVATDNQNNFNAERNRIRSVSIFSREGWQNRVSAFVNFFRFRGYRSDSEIAETENYETSRDVLQEKIDALRERARVIGEGIDQKNQLLAELSDTRTEILESMDDATEIRDILMKALKEATTGANKDKYDTTKAGDAIGALDEVWSESDSDGSDKYEKYRKDVMARLKTVFKRIVKEQQESVKETVNPKKLQEFGKFVDEAINTEEGRETAKEILQQSIDKAKDPAKQAHLALMMRRLESKEF
ncbi:MAG: hypothetical protein BWY19_00966 [bacterium ADurb.Bin212]|nr:MAG: hypothetical protein BWY19_00966 [bacterium ADurb.Bin212]